MIENDCAWATPKDTWTTKQLHKTTAAEEADPTNDKTKYPFPQPTYNLKTGKSEVDEKEFLAKPKRGCRVEKAIFPGGEVITGPRPWEVIAPKDVPTNVNWANMDGINYLSWNKN